jgi:hypothetical protein
MFARSCLSIAMGNADREPQRAARHVTRPNTDNGFVHAMERYVLPAQAEPHRPQAGRLCHSASAGRARVPCV